MARLNKKRLSMDLPIEMHDDLKKIAQKHHMTLTLYMLRIMDALIKQEKQYE